MPRRKLTRDEATALAERAQSGEFDDDPQAKQSIGLALQEFQGRQQPSTDPSINGEQTGLGSDLLRRSFGALETATTIGTGAVAEPFAGVRGALGLLFGENSDEAAEAVRAWSDAMTFNPRTQTGNDMLQGLAAPLQKLDDAADWVATKGSFGNEYAATAIYTALIGGSELFGLKGGAKITRAGRGNVEAQFRQIQRIADDLGIDLAPSQLAASVVESAKDMVPGQRAANAGVLQQALIEAAGKQKAAAANKARLALEGGERGGPNSRAFVNVAEAQNFSNVTRSELLLDGFDLAEMPNVQRRLKELQDLDTRSPAELTRTIDPEEGARVTARITDIHTIRNRIDKQLVSRKDRVNQPSTTRENLALTQMRDKLDNWLDQQFNSDMITGDPRALRRWREAVDARDQVNKRFNEDRTIVQMMDRNATPEEVHRYLLGATAAGAKPHATNTISRLREILGDRHPAFEGIRQDFLHEIAAPLLQDTPDFKSFIRNYDNTVRRNPSLVKELGIEQSQVAQLRRFAGTAEKLDIPKLNIDLARSLSQWFVGHQIARASLRVRIFTGAMRMMVGKTRVKQKAVLASLANAQFGTPVINRNTIAAGRAIQGSFLADIVGAAKDTEDEAVGQ